MFIPAFSFPFYPGHNNLRVASLFKSLLKIWFRCVFCKIALSILLSSIYFSVLYLWGIQILLPFCLFDFLLRPFYLSLSLVLRRNIWRTCLLFRCSRLGSFALTNAFQKEISSSIEKLTGKRRSAFFVDHLHLPYDHSVVSVAYYFHYFFFNLIRFSLV